MAARCSVPRAVPDSNPNADGEGVRLALIPLWLDGRDRDFLPEVHCVQNGPTVHAEHFRVLNDPLRPLRVAADVSGLRARRGQPRCQAEHRAGRLRLRRDCGGRHLFVTDVSGELDKSHALSTQRYACGGLERMRHFQRSRPPSHEIPIAFSRSSNIPGRSTVSAHYTAGRTP